MAMTYTLYHKKFTTFCLTESPLTSATIIKDPVLSSKTQT